MGKKRQNLAGLSFFVQLLNQPKDGDQKSPEPVQAAESQGTDIHVVTESDAISGTGITRKAARQVDPGEEVEPRASKKRKVGLLGPGKEKYDATGLVPYYTEASQVPEHLRKCTHLPIQGQNTHS